MAEPVIGKDVEIMFRKNDEYIPYGCATDVSITFRLTEEKSVKTVGSGNWEKPRGQKKGYTIELSGLIKYDDDAVPHAFDLYQYWDAMTAIPYLMSFTNDEGQNKFIEGVALITELSLGGGSQGFASGSASMKGDGAVEIRDLLIPCPSAIQSVQLVEGGANPIIRITAHTGSPARYEYSVDGGGFVTQTATSYIQDLLLDPGIAAGLHSITIIPVCENGYNGTTFETTFEIIGSGGGSCDVPTDIVFSLVTETSATASWTPPGTPPGDGYYWELYVGATFQQSGMESGTSVNLTGLTGGLTYTLKLKSICDAGVSESGFVSDTFTTDTSADPTQLLWDFELTGGTGNFLVSKNTISEVIETATNNGMLVLLGGDIVKINVNAAGSNTRSLFVQDITTGIVLYTDSGIADQEYEFAAVTGHIYQVYATVTL